MDYGASDAILNWAADIIESHPNHRVIITTHAYLFRDGTTLDVNDVVPPNKTGANDGSKNNGDQMWDKLISQHENIFLVMSGHDPCDNIIVAQDKGVHGNVVTQMLIDPQGVDLEQGATGMVAMLYFSNDGKTLTIENYSTIRDEFYMTSSQMTIEIPEYKKSDVTVTTPEDTTTAIPGNETDPDATTENVTTTAPDTDKKGGCGNFSLIPVLVAVVAFIPTAMVMRKKNLL